MKKALCLLAALALILCAASLAEETVPGTVDVPQAGFRFVPPEAFRNTVGQCVMDNTSEGAQGITFAFWFYYAMTEAEREAWLNDRDPDLPPETRVCPLFMVLTLPDGMTFQSFNALNGNAIPEAYVREIGSVGDVSWYLYIDGPNPDFINAIDPIYREEYTALASAGDELAAAFTVYAPQAAPDPYAGLTGTKLEFVTTDPDGRPVTSAELFAANRVTLVNCWATWCGPCVAELPELEALHERMSEAGGGVVGLLLDDTPEAVRALIAENGITYPVVLAPDMLYDFIRLEYVPTSLFVGPDGTVLAAPVVGAHPDAYAETMEALLGGE